MANDLNFDELDQAVHSYMHKDTPDAAVPVTSARPSTAPISRQMTPSPASPPEIKPIATPSAAAIHTPKPEVKPLIQVRSRQSIASLRGSSTTFHDVMPAHRRSPAAPTKSLTPMNDVVTPAPPAKPALPEEIGNSVVKPLVSDEPKESVLSPALAPKPVAPTLDQALATADAQAPKPVEETNEHTPSSSDQTDKTETAAPLVEVTPPEISNDSASPEAPKGDEHGLLGTEPSGSGAMSDALLEDLRNESNAAAKMPEKETTSPAAPKMGLLSETPLELEDGKSKDEAFASSVPAKTGLMDTGEIHNSPTSPVDTSHMLDAGNDDDPAMQVFDTKEYHTPIADTGKSPRKSRVWEVVVIVLVMAIVAAAGFVAYMMAFGSN